LNILRCNFSGGEEDSGIVTINGVVIPRVQKFRYLARSLKRKRILMKTSTIAWQWDDKNRRTLQECCV